MPKARKDLISLDTTRYYHCMSRCVRRAFLCGEDPVTGKNFDHRRQWIEDRILFLGEVMCIDVCAYAVMSNHLHVVLHTNTEQAENLDDLAICQRWHQLYKGTPLSLKFTRGDSLNEIEATQLSEMLSIWRERLCSISWFMRALNEPIARLANAEDKCTGRFFEGRFKSQALLDEKALLSCMAYVDLNPIRAKMAKTPETSDHTSIKQRVHASKNAAKGNSTPPGLAAFITSAYSKEDDTTCVLPLRLDDYLELVDWTGRIIREDKRGFIDESAPPILERIHLGRHQWRCLATQFESRFKHLAGTVAAITDAAEKLDLKRRIGIGAAKLLFE